MRSNKDWVNALVRDVANPNSEDPNFPAFRSFDWYHGHSFAKSLFASTDSKDEESSSEDVKFAYALKMWGQTSDDASVEARGNLMLAVSKRSLSSYFLMPSDNKIQPKIFIGNKVAGIVCISIPLSRNHDPLIPLSQLYENKVDYATYFVLEPEYIHGIYMLPILPITIYTRKSEFVEEEWNAVFADGGVRTLNNIYGEWRRTLLGNLATIDPKGVLEGLRRKGLFEEQDDTHSITWLMAYTLGQLFLVQY